MLANGMFLRSCLRFVGKWVHTGCSSKNDEPGEVVLDGSSHFEFLFVFLFFAFLFLFFALGILGGGVVQEIEADDSEKVRADSTM